MSSRLIRFLRLFLATTLLVVSGARGAAPAELSPLRPRLFVLTDISNEPDDEESLVRLLVYSNEFELEGLVATTSVWLRNKVRPELIRRQIEAYAQVRPNLLRHAPGFPVAEDLLSMVHESCPLFGMAGVGEGKATAGSRALIAAVDRADSRPLWISVWGGANCLAQALWDVRHTRNAEQLAAFEAKLRVYSISDQDDAGAWIRKTFPGVFYVVSPSTVNGDEYYTATWTGISGDRHYKNGPFEHFELVDNPWLTEHVRENHGPLGALYPKVAYIMEGDTPAFLNLIGNGLCGDMSPDWGGWGGRYVRRQSYGETRPIWTNSRDTVRAQNGVEHTTAQATIWRWREAFQHDFAARMDWCVKERAGANHNPIAVLNGVAGKDVVRLTAKSGETVQLDATGSTDPESDAISVRWFHYPEAGSPRRVRDALHIEPANETRASLVAPKVTAPENVHVILEVTDNGTPKLFAYRRLIVEVRP